MGSRRRNLFILLLVVAMVMASLAVIATKKTVLGLDLRGGTELVYEARPTPQNPEIDDQDLDRAIDIIRERTDTLGVSEPEISRVGTDSIRVGLPDVANAERAQEVHRGVREVHAVPGLVAEEKVGDGIALHGRATAKRVEAFVP